MSEFQNRSYSWQITGPAIRSYIGTRGQSVAVFPATATCISGSFLGKVSRVELTLEGEDLARAQAHRAAV